jgi:phospholipase C
MPEVSSQRRKFLKQTGAAGAALGLAALSPTGKAGIFSGDPSLSKSSLQSPIEHWIMIIQENHSFDNYFMGYPGANTEMSPLSFHQTSESVNCCSHNDVNAVGSWGLGAMNPQTFAEFEGSPDTNGYFDDSDAGVSNYWELANEFVLMDNFFSSWMGPSLLNHVINISGNHCNAEPIPNYPYGTCLESNTIPENYSLTFPNIADLLVDTGVSFRYYGSLNSRGPLGKNNYSLWTPLHYFARFQMDNTEQYSVAPNINVLSDVQNIYDEYDWPSVTWITPPGEEVAGAQYCWSEHPPCAPSLGWENWTGPIINAIMASPIWESCAILLTYDDYGGYWDHVSPPSISPAPIQPPLVQVNGGTLNGLTFEGTGNPEVYYYGFRVPALMISPFAVSGLVDHTQYDFTSFLATIEAQFGLPSLGGLDNVANQFIAPFNFGENPRRTIDYASFNPKLARMKPLTEYITDDRWVHEGLESNKNADTEIIN